MECKRPGILDFSRSMVSWRTKLVRCFSWDVLYQLIFLFLTSAVIVLSRSWCSPNDIILFNNVTFTNTLLDFCSVQCLIQHSRNNESYLFIIAFLFFRSVTACIYPVFSESNCRVPLPLRLSDPCGRNNNAEDGTELRSTSSTSWFGCSFSQ